jgi:tetratricopeptide (TPR) repeat protein
MKAYWHIHHEGLLEFTDNIQERIDYIKANKPEHEVSERLRWMTPVKGRLPARLVKARDAFYKAGEAHYKAGDIYYKAVDAYDKAGDAYDKAGDAYDKARDAFYKARDAKDIEALHVKEHPDCPWTLGGQHTIFPVAVTILS